MIIELKKFGTTLVSRQTGRESYLALQTLLRDIKKNENLEINFRGVNTFAPSWADEFLTPLLNIYGDKLILKNTGNVSVRATLEFLEKITGMKFKKVS